MAWEGNWKFPGRGTKCSPPSWSPRSLQHPVNNNRLTKRDDKRTATEDLEPAGRGANLYGKDELERRFVLAKERDTTFVKGRRRSGSMESRVPFDEARYTGYCS